MHKIANSWAAGLAVFLFFALNARAEILPQLGYQTLALLEERPTYSVTIFDAYAEMAQNFRDGRRPEKRELEGWRIGRCILFNSRRVLRNGLLLGWEAHGGIKLHALQSGVDGLPADFFDGLNRAGASEILGTAFDDDILGLVDVATAAERGFVFTHPDTELVAEVRKFDEYLIQKISSPSGLDISYCMYIDSTIPASRLQRADLD